MAIATKQTGVVLQSWVSPALAEALKAQAELERRSVSATIRLAVGPAAPRGTDAMTPPRRACWRRPSRDGVRPYAPRHVIDPEADESRQERPD